jgi:hypothetical protein
MHLRVQPGTEAGTADLRCGWHSVCPTNPGGLALDWVNEKTQYDGGRKVHFTSWASYSAAPPASPITAQATFVDPSSSCRYVRVNVFRPNGASLGDLRYVHVGHVVRGVFSVNAGSSLQWTLRQIGKTLHYSWEDLDCGTSGWSGSHLHQQQAPGTVYAKNGLYPNAPTTVDNVDVTSQSWWLNAVTFEY